MFLCEFYKQTKYMSISQSFIYLTMLARKTIIEIIRNWLETDECAEAKAGGSGHLSDIGIYIEKLVTKLDKNQMIFVEVEYKVIVDSEFTYYPDNPPKGYKYYKSFLINELGDILSETDKKYLGGSFDDEFLASN